MAGRCRLAALALITASCVVPAPPAAPPPPLWTAPGFQLIEVTSGLTLPTSVAFTTSGHMFVAEKRGTIKAYTSVDTADTTPPTTVIDLSADVYEHADRGLLGMTVDPQFDAGRPYVYALYSAEAPLFGDNPHTLDSCSLDGDDGCVIPSKLVRITVDTTTLRATGTPVVLASNWCSQYSSHSIGDVKFGADGGLYASAGEGASFTNVDYGQQHGATLRNPCNGPPTGIGVLPTPPTAAGGALRAQSAAVPVPGFHASSDGAVIKIDPDTGAAFPTNPWASDPDPERAKIVGYGFRNPFRLASRPGTTEMWVADVGWHEWEEIDPIDSTASRGQDFGWPCMEGPGPLVAYQAVGLDLCTRLYDDPSLLTPSFYMYEHRDNVVPGDGCPTHGSSAAAGLAFYEGGAYPSKFVGGLIFSDYARGCTYLFPQGADGQPDATRAEPIIRGFNAVDLELGPGGDVFEVDHNNGKVVRLIYDTNTYPTASIKASTTKGSAPLTVTLDGTHSSDPDPGDTLTYAWDLDGDGQFDDSTAATTSVTFAQDGVHTVRLQVTDSHGAHRATSVTIEVGDQYPRLDFSSPAASLTWSSGDTITFAGSATDPQDGPLPPSALHWTATLHHCVDGSTTDCHLHPLATWDGETGDSFLAPDHEYPSYIELTFTATDSNGNAVSESRELHPNSVQLRVLSDPPGATVVVGEHLGPTPLSLTLIEHSTTTVIATQHQTIDGVGYDFVGWSDGGAAIHDITPDAAGTLIATFAPSTP